MPKATSYPARRCRPAGRLEATVKEIATKQQTEPQSSCKRVMSFYSNRVSLLVGPPGTGKSTVIDTILLINHQLRKKFWVMAESNKAVDVLVDKFCKRA